MARSLSRWAGVAALFSACSTDRPRLGGPTVPGQVSQAQLEPGVVVLASRPQDATVSFDPPNARMESAGEGAEVAMRRVLDTPNLLHPYVESAAGVLEFGLVPFAAAYGAISAGQQRLSPESLSEAERDLLESMKANAGADELREKVARMARLKTGRHLQVAAASGPATPESPMPVSAILELAVVELKLQAVKAGKPEYRLYIKGCARLIRAADNAVLLDKSYQYTSGPAFFIDWTRRGGLEGVAQTGYQSLAEQIAADVFQPPSEPPLLIGPGHERTSRRLTPVPVARAPSARCRPPDPGRHAARGYSCGATGRPLPENAGRQFSLFGSGGERVGASRLTLAAGLWQAAPGRRSPLLASGGRCRHKAKIILCQSTRPASPRLGASDPANDEHGPQQAGEPTTEIEPAVRPTRPAADPLTAIEVYPGKTGQRLRLATDSDLPESTATGQTETQWSLDGLDNDRNSVVQVVSCLAALPLGIWEQTAGALRRHWLNRTEAVAQTLDALPEQRRFAEDLADAVTRRLSSQVVNPVRRTEEPPAFDFAITGDARPPGASEPPASTNSLLALHLQVKNTTLDGKHASSRARSLCVRIQATIIRLSDGQELYSRPIVYRGDRQRLKDWAASDARLFRRELRACAQRTAEALAAEMISRGFVTQDAGTARE